MSTRTRTSDTSRPGISRRKYRGGWTYLTPSGATITDAATIERIEALVIPPAWSDVWIAPDERGHIQAVGIDAAGRRQYVYHEAYAARRAARKWERVEAFGAAVAVLRDAVADLTSDPSTASTDFDQMTGWSLRLLDRSYLRVGNIQYQRNNGTYGLCTLQRRHVDVLDGAVQLDFVGKSGQHHLINIIDDAFAADMAVVLDGRGRTAPAFGWREGRSWRSMTPARVNRFIAAHIAGSTAKDFRTWHATTLAAAGLVFEERIRPDVDRAALVPGVIKQVAGIIGNTPAVTRASYVDPRVLDAWHSGDDIGTAIRVVERLDEVDRTDLRDVVERAVLDLLAGRTDATIRKHAQELVSA
jgi:DNA topoisomerase IB